MLIQFLLPNNKLTDYMYLSYEYGRPVFLDFNHVDRINKTLRYFNEPDNRVNLLEQNIQDIEHGKCYGSSYRVDWDNCVKNTTVQARLVASQALVTDPNIKVNYFVDENLLEPLNQIISEMLADFGKTFEQIYAREIEILIRYINFKNGVVTNPDARDEDYAFNAIVNKNVDYLMMTEMAPIVPKPDPNPNQHIEAGNFNGIITKLDSIGLSSHFITRTHYKDNPPDETVTNYFFLANGIFSRNRLVDRYKKTYNIGTNRILQRCAISLFGRPAFLYLTHVQDQYDERYDENILNIVKVIKHERDIYGVSDIILCGDMNYAIEPDGKAPEPFPVLEELKKVLVYVSPVNKDEISFTGFNKRRIIDHFYVSRDILRKYDVVSKIHASNASDHYPVILDVSEKI